MLCVDDDSEFDLQAQLDLSLDSETIIFCPVSLPQSWQRYHYKLQKVSLVCRQLRSRRGTCLYLVPGSCLLFLLTLPYYACRGGCSLLCFCLGHRMEVQVACVTCENQVSPEVVSRGLWHPLYQWQPRAFHKLVIWSLVINNTTWQQQGIAEAVFSEQ